MEIPLADACGGVNLVYKFLIFEDGAGKEGNPFWLSDPMLASGG